jgi:hypothetical protein
MVWIKNFNAQNALRFAEDEYDDYIRLRAYDRKTFHPTHRTSFSENCMGYYKGLSAAQSTMGIAIRTGNIALMGNPIYHRQCDIPDETSCPLCGNAIHTAEHLFLHCKALDQPRAMLQSAIGTLNWEALTTTYLEIATAWAIQYFDMEHFERCKKVKAYQFPRAVKVDNSRRWCHVN